MTRSPRHPLSQSSPAAGWRAPGCWTAGVLAAGFVISMAASLPGQLSYDSVIQLLEGRTAIYGGWHPPIMSWLLGLADAVFRGTSAYVAAIALVLFGALLSMLWLVRRPSWLAVPAAGFCILTPQFLIYQGIVWKDVLFANAAVAGFVALAHVEAHWRNKPLRCALCAVALLLLSLAALARQNGAVLLPIAAVATAWIARRNGASLTKAFAWGGGALAIGIATVSGASFALAQRVTGPSTAEQIRLLEFYDLNGALAVQPNLPLPRLQRTNPTLLEAMRSDGRRLYSPVRNDTMERSAKLQAALAAAPDNALHSSWARLVRNHPALYLRDRANVFRWVFLTPNIRACVPYVVGVGGLPDVLRALNLKPRFSARDALVDAYGKSLLATPLFSHATFMLLALAGLAVMFIRRQHKDAPFACLLAGAIAFSLSFFFISIACDYRYLYFLDLAALTAVFYLALTTGDRDFRRQTR